MNREAARQLALRLMAEHGVSDWGFRFDRARRRAGACHYSSRTISLSAQLTDLYDEATVRGVVLHEIAHALVGARHHHDRVWKAKARELGAPDSVRLPRELPSVEAPWVGTCARCGMQKRLFSAPRRVVSCGSCDRMFNGDLVLEWSYGGVPTVPGGRYARELAHLKRNREL